MTNREFFTAIVSANINADLTAHAVAEIAKLDKKNAKRKATEGEIKTENKPIAEAIVTALANGSMISSDLAKAIERGDEAMIATIAELMLDENLGGLKDSKARSEMGGLIEKGFDVIPRSVQDTITYDGEEYTLTASQRKAFEKVYAVGNEAVASLVKLPQYAEATDEVKAKAINFIYSVYYNLALQDFLGVDLENKNILFAEAIDIEKLALIVATARTIVGDTDKKGKVVSGSRKKKVQAYINSLNLKAVQKYMVMGYLGYSNQYGENQVKAYINRLSLTKAEKEKLLAYSGYAS